nr:hypothetical protein [Tanacetum cinerariifolium]
MSLLQTALDACATLTLRVEHLEHDKEAQTLEITKQKKRVKKLERVNKVRAFKLRRLKKVGTSQRVETFNDTIMEDVSNQGKMILELDRDEDGELIGEKEKTKEVKDIVDNAQVEGRQSDKQAEIYQIDLDHPSKVLSMQEDDLEMQEVVEVVTTAKLITEVVNAASTPVSAASIIIPTAKPIVPAATLTVVLVIAAYTRRRKGVIIKDPKEEYTLIKPVETKSKDKGKGIMIEEPKPMKKKDQVELDEEYQVMKKRPRTKAQARNNMMIYLKNTAGFKLDYFKGMSYDVIRPIFEAKFNINLTFLLKSKEQMEKEEERAITSINETPARKAAKRRKLNEEAKEVEDLKQHLDIVPDEDDDVYREATPLARKVPVVDYQVILINNKPRYKIIRADGTHQLLDGQDNVWKSQRSVHGQAMVKSWKLLTSCGVHIIFFTTTQPILLVERRYALLKFTLEQMVNGVRLQVEEQTLELILPRSLKKNTKCFNAAGEEFSVAKDKLMLLLHFWARIGYEKPSTKLTFYKAFFSSQWKFLIHTILQSMSAKRTSWNEFSSAMASAVICLSTCCKFNISKFIFDSLVRKVDSSSKFYMYPRIRKGFLGVETPLFEGMLAIRENVGADIEEERVPDNIAVAAAQELLLLLLQRIGSNSRDYKAKETGKKLERVNKVKAFKLRRLKKVGTSQRVETSDDTIMEDISNQGRMIVELDMEVVTTAKLITEVVNAASTLVSAASIIIPTAKPIVPVATLTVIPVTAAYTKRRKGVIIKDPKEESTPIKPAETKSKDKSKGIMIEEPKPMKKKDQVELDEEYARKLHEELNKEIDWDMLIEHMKQKAKEDKTVQRYQVMKKRHLTEAQACKNMMIYLKNTAGFKLDYFKGLSYDDIRLIFEAKFNTNLVFLLKSKEEMVEEEERAIASINETQAQKAAKRRKLNEEAKEVEDLKQHLEIVLDEDDDVHKTTASRRPARVMVEHILPEAKEQEWNQATLELMLPRSLKKNTKCFNAAGEEFSAAKDKLMITEGRPSILKKGSYVPRASPFLKFLDNKKDEGELMQYSIDHGPLKRKFIDDPRNLEKQIYEPIIDLSIKDRDRYYVDIKVMNHILHGIPNYIYNSVDACDDAQAQPCYVTDPPSVHDYDDDYQGIVRQILVDHALRHALTATTDVPAIYIQQLWRTVKQVPNGNENIRFMVDKKDIIHNVDIFCATLELPVETPEQPFIVRKLSSPKPYLKIRIMYKKSTPTTPLPLSDNIKRDDIIEATQLSLAVAKNKVYEEQQNVAAIMKGILEEDLEKLVKGEDESIGSDFANIIIDDEEKKDDDDDDKHDDAKDNDDDDDDDQPLIKTRRMGSLRIRTEKMQTPIPSPLDSPGLTYLWTRLLLRN